MFQQISIFFKNEENKIKALSALITFSLMGILIFILVFKTILGNDHITVNSTQNSLPSSLSFYSEELGIDHYLNENNIGENKSTYHSIQRSHQNMAQWIADKFKSQISNSNINSEEGINIGPPQMTKDNEMDESINNKYASFSHNLNNRIIINKPANTIEVNEKGTVVVEVVVDASGQVIDANPNGRGTNTNLTTLKNKALEIVKSIRFSKTEQELEQRGTITIIFNY